ncbi:hypothetical protein HKD37_19G053251 [Glycine soja]|nr:hypothetical protein JHK87_052750 [Glycine soja]
MKQSGKQSLLMKLSRKLMQKPNDKLLLRERLKQRQKRLDPTNKVDKAPTVPTSHEATSKDTTAITIHTTTFGPTTINFAPSKVMTKVRVKEIIRLVMDNFANKQRDENQEFRRTMQQAITIHFSSLNESFMNLQQA